MTPTTCLVREIRALMQRYEEAGGDVAQARLLWCTHPGCRAFDVVDDFTHRIAQWDALCPDHRGDDRGEDL